MNILYNIFAVTGFLFWLVMLIIAIVILYCLIADIIFYYFGRTNNYEPMEVPPSIVERKPTLIYGLGSSVDGEFHGGRYQ